MTQLEAAKKGIITEEMCYVAQKEKWQAEDICQGVAEGRIVICANKNHHNLQPAGIGKGLRVKVNANLGTSSAFPSIEPELEKLQTALDAGADSIMDLSTGGNIRQCLASIISKSPVMVGTVPIYAAAVQGRQKYEAIVEMSADDILQVIREQAECGADFMTLHCGITQAVVERMCRQGRRMNIVSRGGSFLAGWMLHNQKENPLYEHFDDILAVCREHDVTLSLGDSLRPGCLADATDRAQIEELIVLGELVLRARKAGVQVMVEGPGHMPYNQIETNMKLQQSICHNAPFYVLGPLVTDIAPGYDHITAAIGGTLAAVSGASFLCYVTPAEHLALPTKQDVHDGVMASRIAAHAADLANGLSAAWDWDLKMAEARSQLDWKKQMELAIDPSLAAAKRKGRNSPEETACSMCGEFCAVKIVNKYLKK